MKGSFGKVAMAAIAAGVLCFAANGAGAKDPERPYRGRTELTTVSVGMCNPGVPGAPGFLPALAEGTIIATHMGRGEVSACTVVTGFVTPVLLTVGGQGVTTAANGDELNFTLSGAVDVSSDPCTSLFTVIVTGGTGRFENASGLIQGEQTQPWSAPFTCGPESSSKLTGTITY